MRLWQVSALQQPSNFNSYFEIHTVKDEPIMVLDYNCFIFILHETCSIFTPSFQKVDAKSRASRSADIIAVDMIPDEIIDLSSGNGRFPTAA